MATIRCLIRALRCLIMVILVIIRCLIRALRCLIMVIMAIIRCLIMDTSTDTPELRWRLKSLPASTHVSIWAPRGIAEYCEVRTATLIYKAIVIISAAQADHPKRQFFAGRRVGRQAGRQAGGWAAAGRCGGEQASSGQAGGQAGGQVWAGAGRRTGRQAGQLGLLRASKWSPWASEALRLAFGRR